MHRRGLILPFLGLLVTGIWANGVLAKGEEDLTNAIRRVAKGAIPAVVHIDVIHRASYPNPWLPFKNDPFFRFFFDIPDLPERFERVMKGIGTGFLIDERGHIITNYHVIAGATEIEVLLADERRFQVTLVGAEPKTDLAVLRIKEGGKFPYLAFGDSDSVEVGEWVVAVGHPRGLDHTVTQGIISAKHRRGILDPNSYQDFLQTDAAINPGNSGGPLLNLKGEVIGINTAIVSQSGGYEGIGFAIPSNMASYVANQLIKNGKVVRGWLGASLQDLSPELAKRFGLKEAFGCIVTGVEEESPAQKSGLKKGDIIQSLGEKRVKNSSELKSLVALMEPGKTANLSVWRDGNLITVPVQVGSQDHSVENCLVLLRSKLGADLRPIKPEEGKNHGIFKGTGLVICSLDPKGPFALAGLEIGDILLEVNGAQIKSISDLVSILNQMPQGTIATFLAVDHRTGKKGYVQVRIY
ncbi:MAG: trypsin-like peptidase domain-containing protein [Desulfatiglandales bacterium]